MRKIKIVICLILSGYYMGTIGFAKDDIWKTISGTCLSASQMNAIIGGGNDRCCNNTQYCPTMSCMTDRKCEQNTFPRCGSGTSETNECYEAQEFVICRTNGIICDTHNGQYNNCEDCSSSYGTQNCSEQNWRYVCTSYNCT